jgi:hypothetical protein
LQIKARELGLELSLAECENKLPKIMAAMQSRSGGLRDEDIKRIVTEGLIEKG